MATNSIHVINGAQFEVAYVSGGAWTLRRLRDQKMFRTWSVELKERMSLTPLSE